MSILKIYMIKAYVDDVLFILFFLLDRIFYELIGIQYNNNDLYYQCVQHDIRLLLKYFRCFLLQNVFVFYLFIVMYITCTKTCTNYRTCTKPAHNKT